MHIVNRLRRTQQFVEDVVDDWPFLHTTLDGADLQIMSPGAKCAILHDLVAQEFNR